MNPRFVPAPAKARLAELLAGVRDDENLTPVTDSTYDSARAPNTTERQGEQETNQHLNQH